MAHQWGPDDERIHPRDPISGEWARRISGSMVWGKLPGETITDSRSDMNGTKRIPAGHLAEHVGSLAGELEVYDQPNQMWHPLEAARPSPYGGGKVQLGGRGRNKTGKETINGFIVRSPEELVHVRPVVRD